MKGILALNSNNLSSGPRNLLRLLDFRFPIYKIGIIILTSHLLRGLNILVIKALLLCLNIIGSQ